VPKLVGLASFAGSDLVLITLVISAHIYDGLSLMVLQAFEDVVKALFVEWLTIGVPLISC
jgi:hypothetical protein